MLLSVVLDAANLADLAQIGIDLLGGAFPERGVVHYSRSLKEILPQWRDNVSARCEHIAHHAIYIAAEWHAIHLLPDWILALYGSHVFARSLKTGEVQAELRQVGEYYDPGDDEVVTPPYRPVTVLMEERTTVRYAVRRSDILKRIAKLRLAEAAVWHNYGNDLN
jgi:hypothetical protein